jgi:hypothetical protein
MWRTIRRQPEERSVLALERRARSTPCARQRELSRLEAQIGKYVEEGQLRLNPRGQAALDAGNLPNLMQVQGGGVDPRVLFDSRELDVMIQQHLLTLRPPWTARFERYAELQRDHDRETVALFVERLQRSDA